MNKKILSTLLALTMIISAIPVFAEEAKDITVYLSLSKYGEIVEDKNGEYMAYAEVNLSGGTDYNLNDVFLTAHEVYYENGTDGYASSVSNWGFGIDKLWGDTSYNFGYQVNGNMVFGLDYSVENGDYIDSFIYENPYTECYSLFDKFTSEAYTDKDFELILFNVSDYDDSGNNIFSPCEGATIIINGEETDYTTDENGKVIIRFESTGTNIISATKEKHINEEEVPVPAITAPVCVVQVEEHPAIQIMHNIAREYTQINFEDAGGNLPWIIADMAIYEELFEDSESILTERRREEALTDIVAFANDATTPGDIAKSILALCALGYDAKKVYTKDFEKLDVVAKLTALVDARDTTVTNIYTIPYVIIALSQADGYATDEQMQWLVDSALESKSLWQELTFGTDALTPMILALAPYYYTRDEVKTVIDETVEILKFEQREDGLIDGFEGYESASTGLAICALSAVGIDSETVKKGEKSLLDGLLSTVSEEHNGFSNAFATEQGFRGLLAWRLIMEESGKTMYDFSNYSMDDANVSGAELCPVVFEVTPGNAVVKIEGKQEFSPNCFDLDAGSYTYTASASDYVSETGTVTVIDDEVENHTAKKVLISLSRRNYSSHKKDNKSDKSDDDTEQTEIKIDNEEQNQELNSESIKKVFGEETFSDVQKNDWYYDAVEYAYENNLFNGTDKGFEPNASMTRAMLVTVLFRLAAPESISVGNPFIDIPENAWYTQGVKWAAENNITSGVSDTEFAPNADITREQLAVFLYRYALYSGYDTDIGENQNIFSYSDYDKISEYALDAIQYLVAIGVMNGRTQDSIDPEKSVTRAEVATMMMRFAEVKNKSL